MAEEKVQLFNVIVEMFQIEWNDHVYKNFLDKDTNDQKSLIDILASNVGIYAFYNSELEIVYLGKTKKNLWDEMRIAYSREMPHYKRYKVIHPRHKYKPTKDGYVRKLQLSKMRVWDTAWYFSAYAVDPSMIDDVERLLIRILPNDLLNKRMEGNMSLSMNVGSVEE